MSEAPVVVGVDGSESAMRAVRWGAAEAARRRVNLVLVHALGIPGLYLGPWPPDHEVRDRLTERGEAFLHAAADIAREDAQVRVRTQVSRYDSPDVLIDASRTARMVVLGASGRGGFLAGLALGSTAVKVCAHGHSPVVVVRGEEASARSAGAPVVVGVDGSPLSDAALGQAFEEAALRGAPLVAVHAWYDNEAIADVIDGARFGNVVPVADIERQVLTESIAGWSEKYPDVTVHSVVQRDKPRRKLLALSGDAQLLVVGSRGRGGFTGLLLGSTSQALIHHADCTVMVVRPASDEREDR